jgi:uncharacterized protein (DUF934 family)
MRLLELKGGEWILGELKEGPGLLRLGNDHDLAAAPPDLAGIETVRLDWPLFKHGQAFTQARLLRERYGFEGQVRAGGALFRDQALFAARCGVDAFEVEDAQQAEGYRESLRAYVSFYQPAVRGAPAWRARHGGGA